MRIVPVLIALALPLGATSAASVPADGRHGGAMHELEETSATLVLRDGGHVELRLLVPVEDALRRMLMPTASTGEFRRTAAAMPEADFVRAHERLFGAVASETRLLVDGRTVSLAAWRMPAAAAAQSAIRNALMASLVDGESHAHVERLPVTADAVAGGGEATLQLELPAVLGPYLMTVYRPRETWVRDGGASPVIDLASLGMTP